MAGLFCGVNSTVSLQVKQDETTKQLVVFSIIFVAIWCLTPFYWRGGLYLLRDDCPSCKSSCIGRFELVHQAGTVSHYGSQADSQTFCYLFDVTPCPTIFKTSSSRAVIFLRSSFSSLRSLVVLCSVPRVQSEVSAIPVVNVSRPLLQPFRGVQRNLRCSHGSV